MLFQFDEVIFPLTGNHELTGCEVNVRCQMLETQNAHPVDMGFAGNVFVERIIGVNLILMIRKDIESAFCSFLLQVRKHFGIDAFFKQQLLLLHTDNLSAVIRKYEAIVFIELQL
ncbi:hypothetical protein SDC9_209210 [bioreactor metagenome]|uniref:Uncharacterized protein n=1 Tax=bioreactor metagenome TaxID=1076179 RepID=A0A645JPG3_9ZZZZ